MMMHLGLFAAAATLAVISAEIDGIGATNLPIVATTALLEPRANFTKKKTASAAKERGEHATYSGRGVRETLVSIEKVTNTDLNRPTAMEFETDDENSTDWIK